MRVPGTPEIAVDVRGTGPLLVFLHGIGGNRGNWLEQLGYFGTSYTTVAWDARGYGDSTGDNSDNSGKLESFHDFADDLARLIRHFGGPAHVVGLSMGGRIALDAWARTPELITSLTLADTSAGTPPSPERVEAFLAVRRKPLVEDGKTPGDIAPDIARAVAGPNITPAAMARLVDSHARLHHDAYLTTMDVVTRFADFPPLASVTCPTLVLVGEYDHIATPAHAAAMAAALPNARLHVIPGAGHISNIEAPDAFNAALEGFLHGL